MLYRLKVAALKWPRLNYWWRYWRALTGSRVGHYNQLPALICRFVKDRSFVDIGCMWGVNGEYAFHAESAGAAHVVAVDVFGPTPEFEHRRRNTGSGVQFVLGDVCDPQTLAAIGPVDVVFCAGVLYHHPSPFDLLVALRQICRDTLILRTSTIPEIRELPNAAVFYPQLNDRSRGTWSLSRLGLRDQVGISTPFDPAAGYGNWFWGLTPSCLRSMLAVSGFEIVEEWEEVFARTIIARPAAMAFHHRLPGASEARELAAAISEAGLARPA